MTPESVITDRAAASPPVLAAVAPEIEHQTGTLIQHRIERDHQHLTQRSHPMRWFRTGGRAQTVCAGQGFIRNLAGGVDDLGREPGLPGLPPRPRLLRAWADLTLDLLAGYGAICPPDAGGWAEHARVAAPRLAARVIPSPANRTE